MPAGIGLNAPMNRVNGLLTLAAAVAAAAAAALPAQAGECLGCGAVDVQRIGGGPGTIRVIRAQPALAPETVLVASAPVAGAELVVLDRRPYSGGPYADPLGRRYVRLQVLPVAAGFTGAKVIAVPPDAGPAR